MEKNDIYTFLTTSRNDFEKIKEIFATFNVSCKIEQKDAFMVKVCIKDLKALSKRKISKFWQEIDNISCLIYSYDVK